MHTTSRLGLQVPDGTDSVSNYPANANQALGVLDTAATYYEGTLVSRPAASAVEHGRFYRTTDLGTLSWSDGSFWWPLGLTPAVAVGGGTQSVASGQALIITGIPATTVTLPPHAYGQMVAIIVRTNGTATVSGTNIQGLGLFSASSFPLGGHTAAPVVLLDDGTNWNIISGQQDSGWQTVSLGTNISALAGAAYPAARLQGDRVFLKGAATASSSYVANATVFTLPLASMYPPATSYPVSTVGSAPTASITTGGVCQNTTGGAWTLTLDGTSYSTT